MRDASVYSRRSKMHHLERLEGARSMSSKTRLWRRVTMLVGCVALTSALLVIPTRQARASVVDELLDLLPEQVVAFFSTANEIFGAVRSITSAYDTATDIVNFLT